MALILKVEYHLELGEFKHISLLRYLYKLVVKVLVYWLAKVTSKLISLK